MEQVEALMRGNEKVFVTIYHDLHEKVFHYFLKRTRDGETARELTQNAFVKLWNYRERLSLRHTIDTQIFTISNSVLIDHLRREAIARKYLSFDMPGENDHHSIYEEGGFESADYLHVAARQLPPVRRNVFLLKMIQGYSNREVAEELSISIKTVEDHYTKAMNQIRSLAYSISILAFLQPVLS